MIQPALPGTPSRGPRTGWRRLVAVSTLAGLAVLAALATRARPTARDGWPHPTVGQPLPALVANPPRPGPRWDSPTDLAPPAVLIYASASCPHCQAQLEAWDRLLGERGGAAPWVILVPEHDDDPASIPLRLRARLLVDVEGEVARALDARRVPLTIYVDQDGRVAERIEGRQGAAEMIRSLTAIGIASAPGPTQGDHP